MTTRWAPGACKLLAWDQGLALLDGRVNDEQAEALWLAVQREAKLGVFLQALMETTGAGLLSLPPFAVAILDGRGAHVAVRGPWSLLVRAGEQELRLSGKDVTTWAERLVAGATAVDVQAPGTYERSLPIVCGIADAGRVIWTSENTPPAPAEPASAPEEVAASQEAAPPDEADVVTSQQPVASGPPPVAAQEPPAPEPPAAGDGPGNQPETPANAGDAEDREAGKRGNENPGNRRGAEETIELTSVPAWLLAEGVSVREPGEQGAPAEPAGPAPAEEAPAAPGAPRPPERDAQAAAPGPAAPGKLRDGLTVADDSDVPVAAFPGNRGPKVLAAFCEAGHPNPPQRVQCYQCNAHVGGQPQLVERPQLGWLRVTGGETVPLRGPVVAGRNPKTTALSASEAPRLIALPHRHISSNHIAFIPEGWAVLVRDLGSSNGSYLRRHGNPPIRLPENDTPLVPGDVIDLGHGVFINLDRIP